MVFPELTGAFFAAGSSIQLAQSAGAWFIMQTGAHMVELADTLL
jgi:hypothetical protein